MLRKQKRFRSYNTKVCTEEFNKIALNGDDHNLVIISDGKASLPHGYKSEKYKHLMHL